MSDFGGRVRQVCQSCIWPVQQIILKKNNFSKNLVFCMFLGVTGENILIRHNLVCSLLTRLSFPILELNFEIFFQQFRIFSSLSWFQYELLPYLAQKFPHSRQKCILRVQTDLRWKIGLRLDNVRVFLKHLDSTQKKSDDRQSCLLPARRIILKKNNFSKELCFLYIFET